MKDKNNDNSKRVPLCACMISKVQWERLSPTNSKRLGTAVFANLRACPFCRLHGKGKWGRIVEYDRRFIKAAAQAKEPRRLQRWLLAFKTAAQVFADIIRIADEAELQPKQ